jgi:hypothetical protein
MISANAYTVRCIVQPIVARYDIHGVISMTQSLHGIVCPPLLQLPGPASGVVPYNTTTLYFPRTVVMNSNVNGVSIDVLQIRLVGTVNVSDTRVAERHGPISHEAIVSLAALRGITPNRIV